MFLSGKRENAITRVNDIIAVADNSTKYNCLQVGIISDAEVQTAFPRFLQGSRKYVLDARRLGTHNRVVRACTVTFLLSPRLSSGDDPAGEPMIFNVFMLSKLVLNLVERCLAVPLKNTRSRFVTP